MEIPIDLKFWSMTNGQHPNHFETNDKIANQNNILWFFEKYILKRFTRIRYFITLLRSITFTM